jgi:hypothetical protein
MKILPVGAELLHTDGRKDGRTDITKLIVAFRNFAKTPKKTYRKFTGKYEVTDYSLMY